MPVICTPHHRRQRGQIMPVAAIALVVLCGIAGLAIDTSRNYLIKRDEQNAADFAALAAAKQLAQLTQISAPPASGSAAVVAAHDFAANNGFPTTYSTSCDTATSTSFTTSWFDATGLPCGATAGFTNKVTVNAPPKAMPGASIPPTCTGTQAYSCVQVVISAPVNQFFISVLGVGNVYVTVSATAQAVPGTGGLNAPPPTALTLYQPQAGCAAPNQCFDESKAAARSALGCSSAGANCPTFWVNPNAGVNVYGVDGKTLKAGTDVIALQSAGDMVVQARTTICDPYNGATCTSNSVVGTQGFAIPNTSKDYCSKIGTGGTGTCATTGQSGLQEVDGSQTTYATPTSWTPSVDTSKLKNCGSLVLNGGTVGGPCASSQEPYLIEPGIYSYIVINHGTYEFDQGLYDITGKAPVNTATGSGYQANGIDHSKETAADFDLCTGGQPNSCPGLTAGVWIGHGGGAYGAYVAPSGSCVGSTANSGGGGDSTVVSGSGVVFRLESGSGGFVTTQEVSGLTLNGAGVGSLASVAGAPLLIDEENSSFIHLDAQPPTTWSQWTGAPGAANTIQGIIYQTPSATGGGVEIDPALAISPNSALVGQVLAYSFTTFGGAGTIDFRNGYGTSVVPGIATSGRNETSIISSVQLAPAAGKPNYSTLTVNYVDEWAMDAYVAYVKVNNGTPVFFSQGIWTTVPGPGSPLPPPNNNPGDQFPAYPTSTTAGSYTVNSSNPPDWSYAIPNSNSSVIEAVGAWTWGHHTDIPNAQVGNYTAQVKYTFPNPNGNYVAITVFVEDGDRCGDYALASYTFKNTGLPFGGSQSGGSVTLVQ